MSESIYNIASRIPLLSSLVDVVVTSIFMEQFLGGQSIEETIPKMQDLRSRHFGTLLGYNIEAELDGSSKEPELILTQKQHVFASIEAQGKLAKQFVRDRAAAAEENRCWVRIKLTGLIAHPAALHHASDGIVQSCRSRGLDSDVPLPGLPHDGDWQAGLSGKDVNDSDREQLLSLRSTMEAMATKVRENNVRIVIDAEHSWYQPVIDVMTDELMQRYNSLDGPATVIASFQAYLRRHPQLLKQQVPRAEEKGFKLMFKQVRGAYMVAEAKHAAERNPPRDCPVWPTKMKTDASFNFGIRYTLDKIAEQIASGQSPAISAVFATHNPLSVDEAIKLLKQLDLVDGADAAGRATLKPAVASNIVFAQIYGMKDDLTHRINGATTTSGDLPLVVKSMSYGDLKECLPFLARRATENKSVLEGRGGAVAERSRLGREIGRRLRPWHR